MAARKPRSKRPSATTSPPEQIVFFVDRSLGTGVRDALSAAGASVVHLDDEHADDTTDEDWLRDAGEKRYVVITKDKRIRKNVAERAALLAANVRAFFLTSGNMTGADMAKTFVAHLSLMTRIAREVPAPFIATVSRTEVRLLDSSKVTAAKRL
jgi:predicted nuclease of predicted toxin-antitoxin system